jgi:hypothetical protein
MKNPRKYTKVKDMPHVGELINAFIKKNRWPKSVIARKTLRSPVTIEGFLKRPSLQIAILWEISHATHYNFIADLAAQLPVDYGSNAPNATQALEDRIAQLEQELEKMTDERDLLKEVLAKR